ncbi:SLC13 family permease [Mariniblastus fucicola]|nr:SLC13 family permease [Mariniblastus fucicola]
MKRDLHIFIGPAVATALFCILFLCQLGWPVSITAAVTCLVAWWWVTEPISIPATSLIPLSIFPLLGIIDAKDAALAYGSPLVQLMFGGFLLSAAMEHSGAHRRIALMMVNLCGASSGRRLVLGFMAASAVLSMWISNAATTLMLLPIVMAVVDQSSNSRFQKALLFGVAYAASIGGIATPIGTPPNLVFMEVYKLQTGEQFTFLGWMLFALPIAAMMLPIAWLWLTRSIKSEVSVVLPEVGQWRSEEIRVLSIFAVTALLWVTRQQPFGGWSELTGLTGANDAAIALLGAGVMFVFPSGKKAEDGGALRLLDWETARTIPWGILILFAGGICIAKAFGSSGLSALLGSSFEGLGSVPVLILVLLICFSVTFLTELTSNTATATLLMPILAAVALSNEIDPRVLMIPATISASFAFMLPVATPPNAIVFGSERISVNEMVREGLMLNLIGVAIVSVYCYSVL